jgi:ubiquinone/menaquinone biosynthesis C-methylase UbiE
MSEPVNPKATTDSTYVLDAESEVELSRLLLQDRLLTEDMGGVWLEQGDVAALQYVLDLACGPGGWVLDVAVAYPEKDVMGIDSSQSMIRYAKAQAHSHGLKNADFAVMDINQPLAIPDESFDLVNARYLVGVLRREKWPAFIQECWRLLRPGGILRLTEPELPITNSVACDQLNQKITLAMQRGGYGFSPQGYQFGMQMELEPLLREAGFEQTSIRPSATNSSSGTRNHEVNAQNLTIIYSQVQPLLLKVGLARSGAELTALYEQACSDLQGSNFHSVQVYLTARGKKPSKTSSSS